MNIGIAGHGVVGKALQRFFTRGPTNDVRIYDKYLQGLNSRERLDALNTCDIVFIAVPTPYDDALCKCDISAVSEVIGTLSVPICIKSTVPPGTTDALIKATGKRIAFSPESVGEAAGHPWPEIADCGFVIGGGDSQACALTLDAHRAVAPDLRFVQTSAVAAELFKHMENTFLATKVAFVNQFYDLAKQAGVRYDELRELFVLDERIGESHTRVTPERGFGGNCFPKDLRSIIAWAEQNGSAPLLKAVLEYNESLRGALNSQKP